MAGAGCLCHGDPVALKMCDTIVIADVERYQREPASTIATATSHNANVMSRCAIRAVRPLGRVAPVRALPVPWPK